MIDQSACNFPATVRQHFHYLADYGFRLIHEDQSRVVYFSGTISFEISQDFRDGMISIEIRNTLRGRDRLTVRDLCDFAGVPLWPLQGRSSEYTDRAVRWLADVIQEHASPILNSNTGAWNTAMALQRRNVEQYHITSELRYMRQCVAKLWPRQDYASIIAVMSPLEQYLKPSERKKLQIARREING